MGAYGYRQEVEADFVRGRVTTAADARLVLCLEYLRETNPRERCQTLSLPRIFNSFAELPTRNLSYESVSGPTTRQVFAALLEGLSAYISLRHPGFCVATPIKTYADLPHDSDSREDQYYSLICSYENLNEIERDAQESAYGRTANWAGALSNVVMISPDINTVVHADRLDLLLEGEDLPPRALVFPAMDFDINATGDSTRDLSQVATTLIQHGFSGYLIQSGDPPNGGYQYLADFVMPYSPYMWQSLGFLMRLFTNPLRTDLARISDGLLQAKSLREARSIMATLGPDPNEEKKRSFPVSLADWGWCWHQIREGMCKFRTTRGKGYQSLPHVVAEIK